MIHETAPSASKETLVTRAELTAYASQSGEKPKFLFPDQRQSEQGLLPLKLDFAEITFPVKIESPKEPQGAAPNFTLFANIRPKKGIKNVSMICRLATAAHYIGAPSEWVWRRPKRLVETQNLVSNESVQVPVVWRPSVSTHGNDMISGPNAEIRIANLDGSEAHDVTVLVEARMMCDDGEMTKQVAYRFRNIRGERLSETIALATLSGIQNYEKVI